MLNRPTGGEAARLIAPPWHTAVLVLGLLVISIHGAVSAPFLQWPTTLSAPNGRLLLYAQVIIFAGILVAYVRLGIGWSQLSFSILIDASNLSAARWLRYLVVAVIACGLWLLVAAGLGVLLPLRPEQLLALQAMLPTTPLERSGWIAFVICASICEEVVYRGYCFRQFHAGTGSALAALLLQAVLYASAHLVLPMELVISVALLGFFLGGLAVWQRSLIPGMIVHVGIGLAGALASSRS